ncbi:putative metallophosphoesterase YhaO [Maioricimonas rarisocia]|uniref:Putative metallophosphoesterase YhaO n=1 Tax=Maioricimonas rarisocia TaxID=2528026 RepID=A0A517Z394_9PLAN|nr:DNA repair exonuclease [Maioricimonas rarisocia]QDU36964.1 putative metallophosphoesterase YhaO [Maioricimonas rarisocia]
MFRFIHAADIHLDSPLRGLEQYEGAPVDEIRSATRRALERLVQLAIEEQVAFVLIAGDLYDGDWTDYNTGLFFNSQMTRLKEAEIPVFLISGNHDAANRMTRSLKLPDNVVMFPHDAPATEVLEEFGVAIHGQSFATQAVTEDLSQSYPPARSGLVNIGVLHTSATGREGHENYAPCTVEGLKTRGYDYWALGHVHTREELNESPHVIFPGNIQGRHIRETGPKGCYLCTVENDRTIVPEFRTLDVFRWELANVDLGGVDSADDLPGVVAESLRACREAADGLPLAVRVELTGETAVHDELLGERERWTNEIRSIALDAGSGAIWVEKVRIRTSPVRVETPVEPAGDDPMGELAEILEGLRTGPAAFETYDIDFRKLPSKLPTDLRELLAVNDPDWCRSIVDEAESLLHHTLRGKAAK